MAGKNRMMHQMVHVVVLSQAGVSLVPLEPPPSYRYDVSAQ